MIRYLILGLLYDGGARHGYALRKEYERGASVAISVGNVYRELQRAHELGWIRTTPNAPGTDPRRVLYEITAAGRAIFDQWLLSPCGADGEHHQDALSLRAFLIVRTGFPVPPRVLDRLQEGLSRRRLILQRTTDEVLAPRGNRIRRESPLLASFLVRRMKHLAADLEFVADLRTALGTGDAPEHRDAWARNA